MGIFFSNIINELGVKGGNKFDPEEDNQDQNNTPEDDSTTQNDNTNDGPEDPPENNNDDGPDDPDTTDDGPEDPDENNNDDGPNDPDLDTTDDGPDENNNDDGPDDPDKNTDSGSNNNPDTGELPDDNEPDNNTDDGPEDPDENNNGDDPDTTDDGNMEDFDDDKEKTLSDIEDTIFSSLSPEQKSIKVIELKGSFTSLYKACDDVLEKVNIIPKDNATIDVYERIVITLSDLKQYILYYVTNTFDTKSYLENEVILQRFITMFNAVKEVFKDISKK